MKSIIRWAINNSPAMNTILVAILLVGGVSLVMMRREVFPEFELEILLVSVPYPGASPEEIEEGICQKIEESIQGLDGIKTQTSVAQEGAGFVVIELNANVKDVQKVLNEVRSEIDQIPSFPELSEDYEVQQITFRSPAIRVAVIAPDGNSDEAELALREVTEIVRDDLLQLEPAVPTNPVRLLLSKMFPSAKRSAVSTASIMGEKAYQIDVEISESTLREYGLTLKEIAQVIRSQNVELPGGSMKTHGQQILVRGDNKRVLGQEIEQIEVVAEPGTDPLTIGDLGVVKDGFADITRISEVDGRPALVINISRTSDEDLLSLVADVKRYVADKQLEIPPGYELRTWYDQSIDVRDRMNMLIRNGLQGLVLVFIVLAIFLELRLAFWVALGIPIAILGAGIILLAEDHTLNMLTMFAFLMALGIVVDDAIVIGENIFQHRGMGKTYVRAAIDGTSEVMPSVIASVMTTIIAFMPLMFVAGVMGKFIGVLPIAIIAMLIISLLESAFILPVHLSHEDNLFLKFVGLVLYPLKILLRLFRWLNQSSARLMEWLVERIYMPTLRWSIRNPATTLAAAVSLLVIARGFVSAGITPFVVFPKLDNRFIESVVIFPDGTPSSVTDAATKRLEDALIQVNERYAKEGLSLVMLRHRTVGQISEPPGANPTGSTRGSHKGGVVAELVPPDQRDITSQQVLNDWREAIGIVGKREAMDVFPGVDTLLFRSPNMGPGGIPIEFKVLAPAQHEDELERAVEACKERLANYPGVVDVEDDSRPGKWELHLRIGNEARSLGVPLATVAETVRSSYYGEEVMRLQRGRHEVKLMVRYPEEERRTIKDFEEIRISALDGTRRPVSELTSETYHRGTSEINRVNQLRSITISADIDESSNANADEIVAELQEEGGFIDQLKSSHPNIRIRWEGQEEQSRESIQSMIVGFMIAMLAMYVLLTFEFRSYFQPLIILAIIPFGAIGAIAGHAVMGMKLTMFSLFGLVALTGVVVNDSIVLVDFINKQLRAGASPDDAVLEAGRRRFRAVLLTSITTVAGLIPLLMERSFQAQVLIPMATSLCFGLVLATALILILVPTIYIVYERLRRRFDPASESTDDPEVGTIVHQLDEVVEQASHEPVPSEVISEPSVRR